MLARLQIKRSIPAIGHPPAAPVAPQSPVDDEPLRDTRHGVLDALRRCLRPTDNGTGNLLFGQVRQPAEAPRGVRLPARDALRRPLPDAVQDPALLRRRTRAASALGGHATGTGCAPDQSAVDRGEARRRLRGMFALAPGGATEALLVRLMALAVPGLRPYEDPLLLGAVLARLSDGRPLAAAALLHDLTTTEPRGPGFAAQLALARCGGPGIDCLLRLCPMAAPATDPLLAATQHAAYATRLRTAAHLCDSLPQALRPGSMAACVRLARRLDPASGSAAAVLPPGRQLLVDGLLCAQSLVDDPASEAPPHRQCAYLAVRNGIFDMQVLQGAQDRLFKINTYIERASQRGLARAGGAFRRLFGYDKSPLHALTHLGTAQSKTRHPRDDVASRCVAMDAFVARLDARLAALPAHQRHGDAALRMSIRIALVRHWKMHIVDAGWRDSLRVGHRMRRAVVADVARQLGCGGDAVERHRMLRAGPLVAPLLDRWSREEALDYEAPAATTSAATTNRSFGEAMAAFLQMEHGGDVLIRRPTRAQTRALLHKAIEDTRQTYSVSFSSSGTVGVQASVIDVLALTPAIAGAGFTLGINGLRGAFLHGGSNWHGGQVMAGSQRAGHLDAGVNGFVGKKVGGLLTVGLVAGATPLSVDRSASRATVVRTRMNVVGSSDGDAWRRLLLQAYDCITRQDGGEGPPEHAAQMWAQLARRFYKNPNLSIDAMQAQQTSLGATAGATLGARAAVGAGLQAGPALTVGLARTYQGWLRQKDQGHNRSTEISNNQAAWSGHASLGLTALAPGITGGAIHANAGQPGATQALTLSTASFGTQNLTFLRNATGVTVRLVTDQGRVDANASVMDTETGSAESFARYIDAHRAEWLAAIGGADPAGELDTFLTRLRTEESRGNVTYGERRRLTPMAALAIDHFRALAVAGADGPHKEIDRLQGEVSRLLNDPRSWGPRSAWKLHLVQQTTSKGPNLIFQVASRAQVSAPRQCDVVIARLAPERDLPDEAVF